MDLRMPEMLGVEAIDAIHEEDARALIIILTTYDSDEDIYHGMQAGARAYILKDAYREELLNCIQTVYAGKMFVSPEIAAKLASRLSEDELTPRELEISRSLPKARATSSLPGS
jgi:two-component system, NarL family, response regulator